jgi:hypothetical protein
MRGRFSLPGASSCENARSLSRAEKAPFKQKESAMKRTIIVIAASFTLGSAALAGGWKESDANGDGQISKAEHDASVTASWAKMDKDGNGQISAAEAGAKATAWKGADSNSDGQISQAEFVAKKTAWWQQADADGNGSISQTEYAAADAKHAKHKG